MAAAVEVPVTGGAAALAAAVEVLVAAAEFRVDAVVPADSPERVALIRRPRRRSGAGVADADAGDDADADDAADADDVVLESSTVVLVRRGDGADPVRVSSESVAVAAVRLVVPVRDVAAAVACALEKGATVARTPTTSPPASSLPKSGSGASEEAELALPGVSPAVAVLVLCSRQQRLRSGSPPSPLVLPVNQPPASPVVCAAPQEAGGGGEWGTGRAGMLYRDLLPSRQGGRYIASHIAIPEGGEVPDFVHYHRVRFQMIFCVAGWVKVVYEDQGEPFIMHAGDGVLQPPTIRHRVLESSAGLEVVEIGCPARHDTLADHDMDLPNGSGTTSTTTAPAPPRLFGDDPANLQAFARIQRDQCTWETEGSVDRMITPIEAATFGLARVSVIRPRSSGSSGAGDDDDDGVWCVDTKGLEFALLFVISGSITLLESEEGGQWQQQRLAKAASAALPVSGNDDSPPRIRVRLDSTDPKTEVLFIEVRPEREGDSRGQKS